MMNRRTLMTLSASALALTPLQAPYALAQDAEKSTDTATEVTIQDPTIGDENAPIEVIEYASFICPHCATFHTDVYPKLKENYIDTGKIKFSYRDVYSHRVALWASMVARCGGNERFFGVSKLIYAEQGNWVASQDPAVIAGNLKKLGKVAGLTQESIDACFKDEAMARALLKHSEDTTKQDDIRSTPSLVINGVNYGNLSYDKLSETLDGLAK